MNELNDKIDDLINHLVFRDVSDDTFKRQDAVRYWKDGKDIPATQAIQALITEQVRLGSSRDGRGDPATPKTLQDCQDFVDAIAKSDTALGGYLAMNGFVANSLAYQVWGFVNPADYFKHLSAGATAESPTTSTTLLEGEK